MYGVCKCCTVVVPLHHAQWNLSDFLRRSQSAAARSNHIPGSRLEDWIAELLWHNPGVRGRMQGLRLKRIAPRAQCPGPRAPRSAARATAHAVQTGRVCLHACMPACMHVCSYVHRHALGSCNGPIARHCLGSAFGPAAGIRVTSEEVYGAWPDLALMTLPCYLRAALTWQQGLVPSMRREAKRPRRVGRVRGCGEGVV